MKKIFTTLLAASLMLLGTQAFAQMSVNGGYLSSSQSFANSNTKSINSNGAYAGVSFNVPVAGAFGIAPGIYYSMITNKSGGAGTILGIPASASSTFMEHAINVPVYFNYGRDLARDTNVFVYAGPTLQYGLASTTKLAGGVGEFSVVIRVRKRLKAPESTVPMTRTLFFDSLSGSSMPLFLRKLAFRALSMSIETSITTTNIGTPSMNLTLSSVRKTER